MKIMANRMDRGFFRYQKEFEEKALEVLRSGWYVLGNEVNCFEKEFAAYTGSEDCVGLASGLDALWIAFRVLGIGPGDEVLVPGNTYIASVMGITMNGAVPVFVEPDEYFNIDTSKMEEKITERTKAILVVHLYGQACKMDTVTELAGKYGLKLVEDCAQSHGAFGDGGAVVVKDKKLAEDFRIFRNYGSEKRYYNKIAGANSRLDEMQAGLLRVRLRHVAECEEERCQIADRYLKEIENPRLTLPGVREGATAVWHQFVIRTAEREELISYLNEREIGTIIHYPIPPHLSEAYQYLGYKKGTFPITEQYADEVLSLPMYNGMTEEEQTFVIEALNRF